MRKPDTRFERIEAIPISELKKERVRLILVDTDNTIVEPKSLYPDAAVQKWIQDAKNSGMTVVLMSNSMPYRLAKIAKILEVRGVVGLKPLPFAVRRVMKEVGTSPRHTVLIGDQILTDYLAASLTGIRMFLVKPLSPHEFFLTRIFSRPTEAMVKWLMRIEA